MFSLFRDELHQRLQIVAVIVYGCGSILPIWKDEPKVEDLSPPSMVRRERTFNTTSLGVMQTFECCVTRKQIAMAIHSLCRT